MDPACARWTSRCRSVYGQRVRSRFRQRRSGARCAAARSKAARIGVWVPWADTDSIGWVRYSLDQRKVPYIYLRDEDIRAGALRDRVDVLLYGHVDLELAEQIQGLPKAWGPMPFKATPQTPSFGKPAESDDITGGIGWEGLAQIQHFVEDGGLLVTLGSGSMLPLEGGSCAAFGVLRAACRAALRVAGQIRRPPRKQAGHAHSGCSRACHFRPARSSTGLRLPGAHLRVSPKFSAVRYSPTAGCAWPIALPASTGRKTAATSSWNGAIAMARRSS